MKKIRYILFLLISFFSFAQSGPNPFADKESESAFNKPTATKDNETQGKDNTTSRDSGGGNPSDPVPIDNYIPLLIITAEESWCIIRLKERIFRSKKSRLTNEPYQCFAFLQLNCYKECIQNI